MGNTPKLSPKSPTRKTGRPATDHSKWSVAKQIGHLKAAVRRDYGGAQTHELQLSVLIKRMKRKDRDLLKQLCLDAEQLMVVAELVDRQCDRMLEGIRKRQSHINIGVMKKVNGEIG